MTYASRVHFRVLIGTACLSFSKQIFVFLLPAHSCIVFNQLSRYVQVAKCFLMNLYQHSISFFFGKKPYISVFWKVHFVASFGINIKAAGIVCELNALVCSLFNYFSEVCQLFSINIASVFILVKCNTVYDSFSRWKALFLLVLLFCTVVTEQLELIVFFCFKCLFLLSFRVFLISNIVIITSVQFVLKWYWSGY
jgi:hypothetical protein